MNPAPCRHRAARAILARFGEPSTSARGRRPPRRGEADLGELVRALDAENIAIEDLQLHQPTLDDVFLAKTGRSLEGAGDETTSRRSGGRMEPRPG